MPTTSRLLALILTASALLVTACGEDEEPDSAGTATPAAEESASACAKEQLALESPGKLTVATDKPAFPPYFADDDPTNGKGFESAVAYAIAEELGFSA